MIMINELMKMIKITFIMKVMIIKSKYKSNKSKNTTAKICGNKTIIKHTINIFYNNDNDDNNSDNIL